MSVTAFYRSTVYENYVLKSHISDVQNFFSLRQEWLNQKSFMSLKKHNAVKSSSETTRQTKVNDGLIFKPTICNEIITIT
jgi:hypothetical protein